MSEVRPCIDRTPPPPPPPPPPPADLKRRISTLKRLITDCDRIAADLDQEIQREEDRVRIHDRAHFAYSTYARATTSRRDNLRRSAEELRAHLAKAQKRRSAKCLEYSEAVPEADQDHGRITLGR